MTIQKYNSNLTPFAKKLRSKMTLAEVLLWRRLNRRQLGVRFNRQKPIGKWVVDFYCKEFELAIEVDGRSHNFKKTEDQKRQRQLEARGIRFLRFWDCEIKNDMETVIARIRTWIQENPPRASRTPPEEGNQENPPRASRTPPEEGSVSKSGVALIVVMWVLVIVSLIVSSFAFEMKLEGKIISVQRKRFKADQLALAGIEVAKAMLDFKADPLEGDDVVYDDPLLQAGFMISEGNVPPPFVEELDVGTFTVQINFEKGRRNINKLSVDEWHELFTQTGVPSADWDELLGCLTDWQDKNDLHGLNGAESDDSFYREKGYECKNGPIDTLDELLLIKGWTPEIVYGTAPEDLAETETPMAGVAQYLTTWGDGKINPNSASLEVLSSLYLSEDLINAILEMRMGPDGENGTDDDGITQEDFTALGLDPKQFTLTPEYVTVEVTGEVEGITSQIYSVFKLGGKIPVPSFWLEGAEIDPPDESLAPDTDSPEK